MAKNNVIPLNIKNINKEVKKIEKMSTGFILIDGKDYEIKVQEHFKETDIQELIKDIMTYVQEAIKVQEDSDFDMLNYSNQYSSTLIIKHFTSLDVPDDVYEIIAVSKKLVDLEIMTKILDMLPLDQIQKVNERVELALAEIGKEVMNVMTKERHNLVKMEVKQNVQTETDEEIKDSEKMIEEAMKANEEAMKAKEETPSVDKDGE